MIEHPNYIAGSELCRRTQKDPFFRTDEKSQFIVMLKFRDQTGLESAIFVSVLVLVSVVLSRSQSRSRQQAFRCRNSGLDFDLKPKFSVLVGFEVKIFSSRSRGVLRA